MRVLVLGGSGMLGHKVVQRLRSLPDVCWTLRGPANHAALAPVPLLSGKGAIPAFDATDLSNVRALLQRVRPTVVVNCLGIVRQRREAEDPLLSITINSLLPHVVARELSAWGGRLMHISTDCVFSGRRGAYTEDDEYDPTDLYGRSKALGEVASGDSLTLRTSIVGRELKHHGSLLDWFLAQRGRVVRGYRRHFWSGVTTPYLADVIARLIVDHPDLRGVYQVASARTSKYELLQAFEEAYGLGVRIEPDDSVHCDRTLVGTRFVDATGYVCPPLATLVREMAADPTPYPSLS